jgi:signal transduction histidine kinase
MAEDYPKLISLAVHELRTPASVVGGYLRMLQRDTDSPLTDRQRRMVEEAEKSCARLVALIAALSDVGKIDDGQITMAPKTTDLFSLLTEVATGVHEAEEREVRLELRGEDAGALMAGDEGRLKAAFSAVFQAILREKPGPCLVVADRRFANEGGRSSAVVVVAEESGVQAAYDAARDTFDEKRGGVGLSLAIARRVIEAHGGTLWSPALDDARQARSTALISLPLGS